MDKANVLEATVLWREVMDRLSAEYPDVELSHMYVDNAAMQLVRRAKTIRRDCDRQYVWRYSLGYRRHAHRFHRHVAVGIFK